MTLKIHLGLELMALGESVPITGMEYKQRVRERMQRCPFEITGQDEDAVGSRIGDRRVIGT